MFLREILDKFLITAPEKQELVANSHCKFLQKQDNS